MRSHDGDGRRSEPRDSQSDASGWRGAIMQHGLVPEGYGQMAAQIIRDRAATLFGRPCAVKSEKM